MISAKVRTHRLQFIRPAKTSRNVFKERLIHLIELCDDNSGKTGVGECAPLSLLSVDDIVDYPGKIEGIVDQINETGVVPDLEDLKDWPSIVFGLETALKEINGPGHGILWDTSFSRGKKAIPINGLVWMNEPEAMKKEALSKLASGFNCMKFKVGSYPFATEWNIIAECRKKYPNAIFRLDANGAYELEEALGMLKEWAKLDIHSIEQPIKAGQWDAMAKLCENSAIPIALDEELIGLNLKDYEQMLRQLNPSYVIFKPSLIGGFRACEQRIKAANKLGIGWWITSALEGNIGLRAIAQWTSSLNYEGHQGLGTGELYENNISCGLKMASEELIHVPS